MHNDPKPPIDGDAFDAAGLSLTSLARRRALLKGLTKGGAVLGTVAAPVSGRATDLFVLKASNPPPTATDSFPNYKTPSGVLCTVSGQQSAVMSRAANGFAECRANGPSYFATGQGSTATARNWPNLGSEANLYTFDQLYPGAGSTNATRYLLDILANSSSSDEAHWIAAYFNALLFKQTGQPHFPFNTTELRSQYASLDPKYLTFLLKFNLA
jgi:hypothetical protein